MLALSEYTPAPLGHFGAADISSTLNTITALIANVPASPNLPRDYAKQLFFAISNASGYVTNEGINLLLNNSSAILFHQNEIFDIVNPVSSMSLAYSNKYGQILHNTPAGTTAYVPDFYQESVTLLQYIYNATQQLSHVEDVINSDIWEQFLAAAGTFFAKVYEAELAVLNAIGQVVKAAEGAFDALVWITTYGPYILLAGAGLWAYSVLKR